MNKFTMASTAACLFASSAFATVYSDATFDLFDNGFGNLDIASVSVSNTATDITFAVTTRDFASWSKYMIFINTASVGGTSSNAWSRPVELSGASIEYFAGSWVDASSDNTQLVKFDNGTSSWDWGNYSILSNSVSDKTVSFTFSLASMNLSAGSQFTFDVATSGGGSNDPGVDHLSRNDPATPGWGTASTAGLFLSYTVTAVPTPGAIALIGLAGLVGNRRRS